MATTAISYGTAVCLAELARAGWAVTVRQYSDNKVGVLAWDEDDAGIFVPCADARAAFELLERIEQEVAGVV